MAHSVRPDSYMEISNFYTATIYEKGAEVVRMISLIIGREAFRRGSDLYFARHDGQAVTTEDFVRAMEEADEKEALRNLNEASADEGEVGPTPIGELIKAQMEGRE